MTEIPGYLSCENDGGCVCALSAFHEYPSASCVDHPVNGAHGGTVWSVWCPLPQCMLKHFSQTHPIPKKEQVLFSKTVFLIGTSI